MKIIIDIFSVVIFASLFKRSLFHLGKSLNNGHKLRDLGCIMFMIVALISATVAIASIIDIVFQIILFVMSLF